MNTFLHLPFPPRPRHDSPVRITFFSTCFQNRLLFRLTANRPWYKNENVGGIPVRKWNHGSFSSHIYRYSVYCTVFSEICTDAEYPVIWFFRKIRDENTLKVKKKNAQSEKKTIFGGCNLNSCRKKLGKNVSFRRDLDPCLLDTSSLEPTNLRSHTAIQLVEGSLIVNSLVPA